jgi:hypothetical protein
VLPALRHSLKRRAELTSCLQVWLHPDYKTPASLSKATKLSFSRLVDFAREVHADEDADSDDEAPALHLDEAPDDEGEEEEDDEDNPLPGKAGVQQFVRDCLSRGGEPMLGAAGAGHGSSSLRSVLAHLKVWLSKTCRLSTSHLSDSEQYHRKGLSIPGSAVELRDPLRLLGYQARVDASRYNRCAKCRCPEQWSLMKIDELPWRSMHLCKAMSENVFYA